jgi:hypothetical protein
MQPWQRFFISEKTAHSEILGENNRIIIPKDEYSFYNLARRSCRKCWTDVIINCIERNYIDKFEAINLLSRIVIHVDLRGYKNPMLVRDTVFAAVKKRVHAAEIVLNIFDFSIKNQKVGERDTLIMNRRIRLCFETIVNFFKISSPKYKFYYGEGVENSDRFIPIDNDELVEKVFKIMLQLLKFSPIECPYKICNLYLAAVYSGHVSAAKFLLEKVKKQELQYLRSNSKKLKDYLLDEAIKLEKEDIILNGEMVEIINIDKECILRFDFPVLYNQFAAFGKDEKCISPAKKEMFDYIKSLHGKINNSIFNINIDFIDKLSIIFGGMHRTDSNKKVLSTRKLNMKWVLELFNLLITSQTGYELIEAYNDIFNISMEYVFCDPENIELKKRIISAAINGANNNNINISFSRSRRHLFIFRLFLMLCKYKELWEVDEKNKDEHKKLFSELEKFIYENKNKFILPITLDTCNLLCEFAICKEYETSNLIFDILEKICNQDDWNWIRSKIKNAIFVKIFVPDEYGSIDYDLLEYFEGIYHPAQDIISNEKYFKAIKNYLDNSSADIENIETKLLQPMIYIIKDWEKDFDIISVMRQVIIVSVEIILKNFGIWRLCKKILDKYWNFNDEISLEDHPLLWSGSSSDDHDSLEENLKNLKDRLIFVISDENLIDLKVLVDQWIKEKNDSYKKILYGEEEIHILKKQKKE